MVQEDFPKMVKSKKELMTPRRRASVAKTGGAIGRVTRLLSRPVSGTAPCVTSACNIKVIVRVRPANPREQDDNFHNVVKVIDDQMLKFDPKEEEEPFFYHGVQQKTRDLLKKAKKDISFAFDRVFGNESTNLEVFANSTKSLITTLMDGYNCSVFAYGATGAGKTFTMIGNPESPGITYLTMKDLFKRKEELSGEREFELMLTYIEVYNELVKDLLNPGPPLNLREDAKYGVLIPGVKGHKIHSPDELFSLLEQGNKRRTQHPTDANAESSRSHAVFQVYLQMTIKGTREVRRAKLSMIDLAGSERGSATGFVGARFKEGANINKSLLALGNCINSLADGHRHVPYRDSKLTRLLKDSLGGNCHTIMIANVSPSSMSFDDTYNTLKYATRAKKIKSNMKRNIVNVDMHIDQYVKQVEDLQTENSLLKSENLKFKRELEEIRALHPTSSQTSCDIEQLTKERDELKAQNDELLRKMQSVTDSPPEKHLQSDNVATFEAKAAGDSQTTRTPDKENLDPAVLAQFNKLVDEKRELIEREFQLQCSELGMSLRRELKVETKDRLSNFYVDTPDKQCMRKKLNEQVERYEKKEKCTTTEIDEIKRKTIMVDEALQTLIDKNPDLTEEYRLIRIELDNLGYSYKAELKQKEIEIMRDDRKDKCSVIENMAALLRTLFLAVGGKADAPESIKNEYENLVGVFNGKKNVKWEKVAVPLPCDSGISLAIAEDEDKQRAAKRKIETDSQESLDSTFTCGTIKSPKPGGSKISPVERNAVNTQMVAKGFKVPASKRLAHGTSPRNATTPNRFSPRNKICPKPRYSPKITNARKPVVRPDTARNLLNVKKGGPNKVLSERPRFKI